MNTHGLERAEDVPAIFGGPKAVPEPLPLGGYGVEWIGEEEERNVLQVLRRRTLSRICHPLADSFVHRFETALRRLTGAPFAVAVNSGASALQVALAALDIGPGDEVLVPGIGWICCATSVINAGAVPVPVEFDESLTPDPDDIAAKVTRRTRAVMVIHFRGQPANMDGIMAIAREHRLKVIEDVAQAFGGSYRGRALGTIGDVGCYSFNMHKIITCGEGGAVVMKEEQLYGRALSYSGMYTMFYQHDHPAIKDIEIPMLNLRMPELCGAVALAQLGKVETILSTLRARQQETVAAMYGLRGLRCARRHDPEGECGYTLPLLFEDAEQAEFFFEAMRAEGAVNVSNLALGFSGGEILGTAALMASQGSDPREQRRFGFAPTWRCMTDRFGPTTALNPWRWTEDPPPLAPGVIPKSTERLGRVVALKFNVLMQSRHTQLVAAALSKVASRLTERSGRAVARLSTESAADAGEGSPGERGHSAAACQAAFDHLRAAFREEEAGDWSTVIQYHLSGAGGGDWYVVVSEGRCSVHRGLTQRPQATVSMPAAIWIDITEGRVDPTTAYLQGQLRTEGELGSVMRLRQLAMPRGAPQGDQEAQ